MGDTKAQLVQLEEEYELVKKAIKPSQAASSLKDYMDQNAEKDALAGTAEGPNPWLQVPPSSGCMCVVS